MSTRRNYFLRTSKYIFPAALLAILLGTMPVHAAPFAYVVNTNSGTADPGTVSVIDSATNTVTATITVGLLPTGIALTPGGRFAYVANSGSNTISVIATATNTVVTSIAVGVGPHALAFTPDGAFAYVAMSGGDPLGDTVSVISTATNTVVASITVGQLPVYVAISPDGAFAYVTNQNSDSVSVISTASNTVVATIQLGAAYGIAITPNGAFAYVTSTSSVSVIATATNTVVATITGPTHFLPEAVAISPNGAFVYVANFFETVEVIATATNTDVASIPLPEGAQAVALSPNGAFAYVANSVNNTVSVIATSSNTVVTSIPVGRDPMGVAFAPAAAAVSVTPSAATGLSNTFALKYSDVYGASNLKAAEALFGPTVSASNSCTVLYAPATNLLYLLNDAGTGSSNITPGSGTLSNSQCGISGSGTSVMTSGNNLTLNLAVTASSIYTGKHAIFMQAEDTSSAKTGWVGKGTWTPAANQPPTVVSVTPSSASGFSNTFALAYSDPNGASDLGLVAVNFSSAVNAPNSCTVLYAPATNLLYLLNDAGTGSSSITPGSGTLSNSQCTISGSGTTVARSGDTLTLNLGVTASSTYTGTQSIFMFAEDNSSVNTGAVNAGTWTP